MTPHPLRHAGAATIFVCISVCCGGAAVRANPALGSSVEHASVTLSTACDSAEPVATLHASIRNTSFAPSAARRFTVKDDSSALSGSVEVPPLGPGASTSIAVPLTTSDPSRLAGKRFLSVYLGTAAQSAPLAQTELDVPQSFCRTGTDGSSRVIMPLGIRAAADPRIVREDRTVPVPVATTANTVSVNPDRPIVHVSDIVPPSHVRAGLAASDCAGHVPGFNCFDAILDGYLILLWEPPESGGSDGYRVYGVDGNGNGATLLASTATPGQTVVEIPAIHGKFAGHCYAVSTVFGSRESTKSNVFCATDGSSTKVAFLSASEARSAVTNHFTSDVFKEVTYGQVVGFRYTTDKHAILADDFGNAIHRSGFAFNLAPYAGHRLVRARLHLTIQTSRGMGNNFSCANSIGTGTEFWWKDDASPWIEGNFSSSATPPTVGPQIVTEVTKLVSPWLVGAPNYGFVLRNTDENLNAFTEKTCETTYEYPQLEITYY